ncbi:MAG: cbb3-type cytochrome c oxidase subunit I, partial [Planctomycetaceae bacterium]
MSATLTTTRAEAPRPAEPRENYLTSSYGAWSWLLTTDHKRIAIMYMIAITFFFLMGGAAATVMRLELMTPAGDIVQPETYNKLFTLH